MLQSLRGNHGFVAFIDESGSEGRHETKGACEFIVVSAVLIRIENIQYVTEICQKARKYCKKPPSWDFPKFAKHTSDEQKHLISCLIASSSIRTAVIAAHKPSLTDNNMHETKYWLSTLPKSTTRTDPVAVAKGRWRIERDYRELKQEVGLGHFEGRGWRGFHHHASLCIAAYGFLVTERCLFPPEHRFQTGQRPTSAIPTDDRSRGARTS